MIYSPVKQCSTVEEAEAVCKVGEVYSAADGRLWIKVAPCTHEPFDPAEHVSAEQSINV